MADVVKTQRLMWELGTVVALVDETDRTKSITLDVPEWPSHRPGQHVDVRLTAEDGYQAQRSYSIASAPEDEGLVLTVERLDDGEVSPYLVDELRAGDQLELRGPVGGYFVWTSGVEDALLLVAGGSGIVPFRSMLRHHAARRSRARVRLLYSARSLADLIYREELAGLAAAGEADVRMALTREWPDDWQGHRGRIDQALLQEMAWPSSEPSLVYVCGPSGFVEAAAAGLVAHGQPPSSIKTERFGPTGT